MTDTAPSADEYPDYKLVVALCAAVSLICSIDRASISVAIVPMGEQYGWSDSAKGSISSAFFAVYTITNLIGTLVLLAHCAQPSPCICMDRIVTSAANLQPTMSVSCPQSRPVRF